MRVDIVSTFYKEAKYAPFFFWGMDQNRDEIGKIIIVNDEPWDDDDLVQVLAHAGEVEIETICLDHEHAGPGTHGVAHSMNQGAAYSQSEYVFFTTFDQILTPATLGDITEYAAPQRMVLGRVDSIGSTTKLSDLLTPTIIRPDMYSDKIPDLRTNPGRVIVGSWRNGHTLVHRQSHIELGGFDEHFVQWGYGLEDQDYCIRWLLAYGQTSIWWGDSSSWHFAGDEPSVLDPRKANWNPAAVRHVNDNLHRLYVAYNVEPKDRCYYQHRKGEDYA